MRLNLPVEYEHLNIKKALAEIEFDLFGLSPIKLKIKELATLILVDSLKKKLVFNSKPVFLGLHMSFTGNSGSGKTIMAKRIAHLLFRLGYVKKGHFISVTRNDIVGQYIGHTAPKTKAVLKRAIGGILLIDEAHSLYKPDNERDYGSEAIEILLQVMENQRANLVVIFAGYKKKMDIFYKSNPGLASRVAHHINFPDYNLSELIYIARSIFKNNQYQINIEGENAFLTYIKKRLKLPSFSNARTIINAVNIIKMKHANRIFNSKFKVLTKWDLVTINKNDVLKSNLFAKL